MKYPKQLNFRVSIEEQDIIKTFARRTGRSQTDILRQLIRSLEFEERLERLGNEIIPVAVVTPHGAMTYAEMAAQEKLSRKNDTRETIDITATTF